MELNLTPSYACKALTGIISRLYYGTVTELWVFCSHPFNRAQHHTGTVCIVGSRLVLAETRRVWQNKTVRTFMVLF